MICNYNGKIKMYKSVFSVEKDTNIANILCTGLNKTAQYIPAYKMEFCSIIV